MNARKILGKEVIALIKRYRDNRELAHRTYGTMGYVKWDKQADLDAIFKAWLKNPMAVNVSASVGHFWFSINSETHFIEVDAKGYWHPKMVRKSQQ